MAGADDLAAGEYVVLEVTDNGSGMSAETQARIFEPFFTTKFTGRGLGLAAVLGIVRGHKGALKVYSELDKGTTFKLLLPAAGAPTGDTRIEAKAAAMRASGTMLVVDDEDAVREVAARMLSAMGFQVLTAKDGAHGLEIYQNKRDEISGVLLDLTMPRMDGEETFREIRRVNPNAFVLLMSGFNEQDAMARFVGKGLAGFIQKPFTPEQLREKLQAFAKFTSA
jgi:two-component system, cell cycle sensor histidine kinase and response regulator CckA